MIHQMAWMSMFLIFKCNTFRELPPENCCYIPGPNQSSIHFIDASEKSGIHTFQHTIGHADKRWIIDVMGSGVAVGDYDKDGDDDLYLVNGRPNALQPDNQYRNTLFRNDGGRFTDITEQSGVGDTGYGMCAAWGDINNDGWLDLYVCNYGPNVLYRNNADGTFSDITAEAGVGDPRYAASLSMADYDLDGDLDIFVGNYVKFTPEEDGHKYSTYHGVRVVAGPQGFIPEKCILYENRGDGTFVDATVSSGLIETTGRAMGSGFFDLENDGLLDLYIANDTSYNHVFHNRGDKTFEDWSYLSGGGFLESGKEAGSMGVTLGDVDNDGYSEILVTTYEREPAALFYNNRNGTLHEASISFGIHDPTYPFIKWGSVFSDFDADGNVDILVTNGHTAPQVDSLNLNKKYHQGLTLLHNTGKRFTDITHTSFPPDFPTYAGRGMAQLDYDQDGDMDVVINRIDNSPLLIENTSPQGNWLQVVLDAPSARAFSARVVARKGEMTWTRMVDGGSGYLSQNSATLHFGFGEVDSIDDLTIYWIGAKPQTIPSLALNQKITVSLNQ